MIADINIGSNLYGALAYNQEKMDQEQGRVLGSNLVMVPPDGQFRVAACVEVFERWIPSNCRTSKPVVHISLNPHPDDRITDEQLAEIGREYMERAGFGRQPYMIFKHEDIARQHLHIVALRVRPDGSFISDSNNYKHSREITDALEEKYGLHRKDQKQGERWELKPVDASGGNLKKQVANVIKPLAAMYRFQTLGEYRALLSLYNIGVDEVKGENNGNAYRGLVYSALDGEGNRAGSPLKSSLFGKTVGFDGLEKRMEESGQQIKKDGNLPRTRTSVQTAMQSCGSESEFRTKLREQGIDLVLRRNDTGRIYGATFIDHTTRTVLNGSRLGKEFSANIFNERLGGDSAPPTELLPPLPEQRVDHRLVVQPEDHGKPFAPDYSDNDAPMGGLLSMLEPEMDQQDNDQPMPKPKKKKKRKHGRQV